MARGPKNHLKRLNAPKNWHLSKMKGIYAPRPHSGAHPSSECVPLLVLVRNLLPYANTAAEARLLLERGNILVNGKVRLDPNYPAGLMDVIHIPSLQKSVRLIYSPTGDFKLVNPINTLTNQNRALPQQLLGEDASVTDLNQSESTNDKKKKNNLGNKNNKSDNGGKVSCVVPCKVKMTGVGNKKMVGKNRAGERAEEKNIPWLTTECGRILRFVDRSIKKFDTVLVRVDSEPIKSARKYQKYNYKARCEVEGAFRMEEGKTVMVSRGKNKGRVGRIKFIEKHLKISDVVFVEDELGNKFVTKKENIMVIGNEKSFVGLDNGRGVRMNLQEKTQWGIKHVEKGAGIVAE